MLVKCKNCIRSRERIRVPHNTLSTADYEKGFQGRIGGCLTQGVLAFDGLLLMKYYFVW